MGAARFEAAVIGGGIVGVATAFALTERFPGLTVVVLEKEPSLARHQTGNNSGVIHSGLYYRPGSLKARNCVAGRDALYRFCEENDLPHERCGKVVIATRAEELPALAELERRGRENGLEGLERLDPAQLRTHEPHAAGLAGLWVPQTGIVDFVAVTEAMAGQVRRRGGEIRIGARLWKVRREADHFRLLTTGGTLTSRFIIGCAGLQSDRVARLCGLDPPVRIVPFRGEYFRLRPERREIIRNLIYPVPDPALPFLGVHFTRMVDGEVEAGPNAVLALKREGYSRLSFSLRDTVETLSYPGFWRMAGRQWAIGFQEYRRSFSKRIFVHDLQRLVPEVRSGDLQRGGSGVRAQAVGLDGKLLDDFSFAEGKGMIHVLNAPSPAATAAFSIGREVAAMAGRNFGLS